VHHQRRRLNRPGGDGDDCGQGISAEHRLNGRDPEPDFLVRHILACRKPDLHLLGSGRADFRDDNVLAYRDTGYG